MKPTVKAAALYVRISQDREGNGLGVERQERLCRDLAARKRWKVAEVYCDNDRSAYTGKPRPAYERMCADITAGRRDGVIVVDTDRLTRHPRELEDFITLADEHRIALANVSGDMDLSTSDGRFRARILGAVARQESEKKSERLRRQREQSALAGRPHPGPRAFGYEPDGMTLREPEAAMIREAAAAVLDGRSVRSIADEWNAAGVTTARGNVWTINAVRDVLVRQRNVGKRWHQGEVVGAGDWPAILDDDSFERLRGMVQRRKRRTGRPPTRLLSTVARCAICDGPMHSSSGHGVPIYACRRVPGKKDSSCGRLSIVADPLDEFVRDVIFAALDVGDLADRIAAKRGDRRNRDLTAALRTDEEALVDLEVAHFTDHVLSRAGYLKARATLEDRITHARAQVDAQTTADVLARMPRDPDDLRGWWDAASVADRRPVVERLFEKVVIRPRQPRMPRQFDGGRVEPVWRV